MATFAVNSGSFNANRYQLSEVNQDNPSSTGSTLTLPSEDYVYYLTGTGFAPEGPGILPESGTIFTIERISAKSGWTLAELDGIPLSEGLAAVRANATDALLDMGFAGDDVMTGGTKNDVLKGRAGGDAVLGGRGNDLVDGGTGDDWLVGGDGADRLIGGPGADTCIGGKGKDRFILAEGDGTDRIPDFQDGTDRIGLAGGLSFAQLNIAGADEGTTIEVAATGEDLAFLEDVAASRVTEADFILV